MTLSSRDDDPSRVIDIKLVYVSGGELYEVDSTRSLLASKGHALSLYVNNRRNPAVKMTVTDGRNRPFEVEIPAGYFGQLDTPDGAFVLSSESVKAEAALNGMAYHYSARFHRGSGTAFFQQESKSEISRVTRHSSPRREIEKEPPAHVHSPAMSASPARTFTPKTLSPVERKPAAAITGVTTETTTAATSPRTRKSTTGATSPRTRKSTTGATSPRARKSTSKSVEKKPLVEVYSMPGCPYCVQAKKTLKDLGVEFKEIDFSKVTNFSQAKEEMVRRTGGSTSVPQIFVDGKYLGGNSQLQEAVKSGKWDLLYQTKK